MLQHRRQLLLGYQTTSQTVKFTQDQGGQCVGHYVYNIHWWVSHPPPPLINSALRTNLNLCSWPFSLTLTGVRRTKPSAALILCVITYLAPFSIRVFWVSWPGMDRNGLMQSRIRCNCEADKYSCKNVLTFSDICVSEMFYPILHFGEFWP